MTELDQIAAFKNDLDVLLYRYGHEFDLHLESMVGVLEVAKVQLLHDSLHVEMAEEVQHNEPREVNRKDTSDEQINEVIDTNTNEVIKNCEEFMKWYESRSRTQGMVVLILAGILLASLITALAYTFRM